VIISHEHRYVFIELPRTGSSTINHELRRNYGGEWMLGKHSTYQDFLRVATPDERTYFAFAGIRNPLDVTVSRYVQVRTDARQRFTDPGKRARRTSLPEQIESRVFDWVRRNDASFEQFLLHWYWLPYDTWSSVDHRRLDFVVRFESLSDDFAEAIRRIGLTPKRKLPARNVTGGRSRSLDDYYTSEATRRRAAWVFGPYMREWDYDFPESWGDLPVPIWSEAEQRLLRFYRGLYWRFVRSAPTVTPRKNRRERERKQAQRRAATAAQAAPIDEADDMLGDDDELDDLAGGEQLDDLASDDLEADEDD
jgi:hypothetical protein